MISLGTPHWLVVTLTPARLPVCLSACLPACLPANKCKGNSRGGKLDNKKAPHVVAEGQKGVEGGLGRGRKKFEPTRQAAT